MGWANDPNGNDPEEFQMDESPAHECNSILNVMGPYASCIGAHLRLRQTLALLVVSCD
jgi:hypothetical protein